MLFSNTSIIQYYLIVLKLDLGLDPKNFWTLKSGVCKDCQLRFDRFSHSGFVTFENNYFRVTAENLANENILRKVSKLLGGSIHNMRTVEVKR